MKFGLRWYLPGVGSWTQEDTLDSPLDPNNANRYAYAGSDPTNHSDTTGALSSFGTYALQCGTGALVGVGLGATFGLTETGVGAVADATVGCVGGVLSQYFNDQGESGNANGVGYLGFLYSGLSIGSKLIR